MMPQIEPLPVPIPDSAQVTSAHLSADLLYLGLDDGSILAYMLPTQTHTHTFIGVGLSGAATALTCTSRRLLVGYADGTITIFSLQTGLAGRSVAAAHTGPVTALALSSESSDHGHHVPPSVYSGGVDGVLNEWDAKTLRKKWMLNAHDSPISGVVCGSGKVFSSDVTGVAKGWDTPTGQCVADFGKFSSVTSMILGRDLLYIATEAGTISVLDTESGQTLRTLRSRTAAAATSSPPPSPTGDSFSPSHSAAGTVAAAVRSLCLAKGRLYSATADGFVQEWDVKKGRAVRKFAVTNPPCVAMCADATNGRVIVSCATRVTQIRVSIPPQTTGSPAPSPAPSAHSAPLASPVAAALFNPNDGDTLRPADSISNPGRAAPNDLPDDVAALKRQIAHLRAQLNNPVHHQQAHQHHAEHLQTRVEDAEEELQAAKDLLVSYKTELEITQQAHAYAFSYLSQSSNRTWFEIEKEIRGLHAMIDNPPTPLDRGEDLTPFLPRRKVARSWVKDEDWDSDVDLDEDEPPWWRNMDGLADRTRPSDIKWWREERGAKHTTEPERYPSVSGSQQSDQDRDDDDVDAEEDDDVESNHLSQKGDDGGAEEQPSTPPPKIRVRATVRLPDGSIMTQQPTSIPSPQLPRRVTVPAATAIAAARSLATSPPQSRNSSSGSHHHRADAAARAHRRQSQQSSRFPAAAAAPVKRLSSWFAPIQSWVENVVATVDPAFPTVTTPPPHINTSPSPSINGTPLVATTTTPAKLTTSRSSTAGSEAASGTTGGGKAKKAVRVRQADVWRFDDGDGSPAPVA
ncbi:hypothetical protein HDU87_001154 [Geranomyces variabilis]|uniref:Uncharacterized protein n=1 Tax=Geranomyces variabilis TaxID=109894 RepID=A0AAD5TH26_9FUNG|nr:hypothetical protein HDU87_001154 [Geranomyces variabilis]